MFVHRHRFLSLMGPKTNIYTSSPIIITPATIAYQQQQKQSYHGTSTKLNERRKHARTTDMIWWRQADLKNTTIVAVMTSRRNGRNLKNRVISRSHNDYDDDHPPIRCSNNQQSSTSKIQYCPKCGLKPNRPRWIDLWWLEGPIRWCWSRQISTLMSVGRSVCRWGMRPGWFFCNYSVRPTQATIFSAVFLQGVWTNIVSINRARRELSKTFSIDIRITMVGDVWPIEVGSDYEVDAATYRQQRRRWPWPGIGIERKLSFPANLGCNWCLEGGEMTILRTFEFPWVGWTVVLRVL